MVKDVWPYLTAGLALTVLLVLAGFHLASGVALLLTLAVASFFRDPRRDVPRDPRLVLSPADGRVVAVSQDEGGRMVSIFLSVFNVHVNRAPVAGRVVDVQYTPGSFLPAYREKASELNEQNLIHLDSAQGRVGVKQIAGLIARRIRCWKSPGDEVTQGEKIGFITFGSRVDLFLPPGASVKVAVGDRVRGGTSVVAVFPGGGTP